MALVGKISIAMMADTAKLQAGMATARRSIQSFEKSAVSTGHVVAGVFAASFAAASTVGFGKMIVAASDLGENVNKVQSVFGDAALSIMRDSERMAGAFGVVKSQSLDAKGRLGGLFKGAGFDNQQAADLSNQFVNLAGDVSSFFNLPFDAAFTKLRSGLSGESEPLKDLGILMNEDMVKAKALAMGFAKQGQELSNQAKVASRAAIIMEGLKDAQGDLAKTATGFANASREASGRVANLAADIGETLLPVVGKALAELNTGIAAVNIAWSDNKSAALDWAAGTVGGVGQVDASMGWLQKTAGGIADSFQLMSLGWKWTQAEITGGVGELIDKFKTLRPLIQLSMGDASPLIDGMNSFVHPNMMHGKQDQFTSDAARWAKAFKDTAEAQRGEFEQMRNTPYASEFVNKYFEEAKTKIESFRKDLSKPSALNLSGVGTAGDAEKRETEKEKLDKPSRADAFSAAVLAGTQEDVGITLRSRFGEMNNKVQDKIEANTRETNRRIEQLTEATKEITSKIGQQFTGLFTLDGMV